MGVSNKYPKSIKKISKKLSTRYPKNIGNLVEKFGEAWWGKNLLNLGVLTFFLKVLTFFLKGDRGRLLKGDREGHWA